MNSTVRNVLATLLLSACMRSSPAPQDEYVPEQIEASVTNKVDSDSSIIDASASLKSRNVLIVGDSQACAVGMIAKETVKNLNTAENRPLDKIKVECKVGSVIQYWGEQGHLQLALQKHKNLDVVVVFLGTNHYWQTSGRLPNVEPILNQIQSANAKCVWVGNTTVKGKNWPVNKMLSDAVSSRCTYFDTEKANITLVDGIHPSRSGSIKWLQLIWRLL